jgi:hypothetical protein
MDKTTLLSKTSQALAVFVLGLAAANVQAQSTFGGLLDGKCSAFNGTKPYNAYPAYGVSHCNLCHNPNNRSISVSPEWDWTKSGILAVSPSEDWKNFCVVQGFIATPATDLTISPGAKINLTARGFSPTLGGPPPTGTSPLAYTWEFSDGRPTLAGATVNDVPFNTAGTVTVTLHTVDNNGAEDPTPDTRKIIVDAKPTTANNDTYSVQSGNVLSVSSKTGVLANDTGVGTLMAKLVRTIPVFQGVLNLSPNGSFDYTPNVGFVGTDRFTYTASNGVITSGEATVTLTVTPAPPVANDDSYTVHREDKFIVNAPGVLANDGGTRPITAVLETTAKGTLNLGANGGFSYKPPEGFTGIDSFTYRASKDINGAIIKSDPATVKLEVGASCTDSDKDGYSPEGVSCGPKDCNDHQAAINPGVKEICTNNLDDDCNGLVDDADPSCPAYTGKTPDCVGKLTANQVMIDSADWKSDKLTVTGSKAKPGATVSVYKKSPVSPLALPTLLGATKVANNGNWKFMQDIKGSANAPCRVYVEINGTSGVASGVRAVTGSTADCSSNNGAPVSCDRERDHEHEKDHERK